MTWMTATLFACADCPTRFAATTSIRKAAWHWLVRGHRPFLASPFSIKEAKE